LAEVNTFSSLVHEAFIAPLRSVLIVDDQYPTWEEIFNSKIEGESHSKEIATSSTAKKWHESVTANEVQKLIREFRSQKPGFIIDIHDGVSEAAMKKTAGSETPMELADHLHQSDLLILDYNLEGGEAGTGGDIARKIISSVLDNQHFNLVVVHTSEDLNKTMHDCLRSLMKSCTSKYSQIIIDDIEKIDALVTIREDEGTFNRNHIHDKLDMASYIHARHPERGLKCALGEFMQGADAFADLSAWAGELKLKPPQRRAFFYWAISIFEKKYLSDFSEEMPRGLSW